MNIITTEDCTRAFKTAGADFYALKGVSIGIETGRITILKGRSGSGKTTLMNILGALDRPTSGKVLFDGVDITKQSDTQRDFFRRKNIGFIFQSVALISTMTALENVEFGLKIAGINRSSITQIAKENLALVGLESRINHRTSELSGGEQQRVAIARAMAHAPKVLFADEPTAELDTHTGLQVMNLFRDIVEKKGITILMTTHDPEIIGNHDLVYTMEDGEII